MFVKVKRGYDSLDKGVCSLARSTLEQLSLIENQEYTVHLGQLTTKVFVCSHDEKNNHMYFSEDAFHQLLLFSDVQINIWFKGKEIFLGPVVGIFVQSGFLNAIAENRIPLSGEKHMEASGEGHCLTYYFSLEDIVWSENRIRGYTYAPKFKVWKRYWFPIPDIIYDRAVGFKTEEKPLARHIRGQFNYHPDIQIINERDHLGKWQLYYYLAENRKIRDWLPETIKYTSFDDLISMINQHDRVFLKSYYGSRGVEIMYIERKMEGFAVQFADKDLVNKLFDKEDELEKEIEEFFEGKKLVVQQGIPLAKYKDRRFDLRLLLNKGSDGNWKVIYRQARLAKENFNITNSSLGGMVLNYEDMLRAGMGNWPDITDLDSKTIELAKYIEKEFGSFGELGMDVAIDEEGKFWFVEANTKPDKNPEEGIEDSEGISPQALAIFEYAKFLAQEKTLKAEGVKDTVVRIKENQLEGDSNLITLPEQLIKELALPSELTLKVGLLEEAVGIVSNSSKDKVEVSSKLMDRLYLKEELEVQILWKENKLHLGPVIGIFVSNGAIRKMNSQRPKFRHIEFFRANSKAKTLLYFFSIKDVDFINSCIRGTYYDDRLKRWKRRYFPIPDIFYDRGGGVLHKQIVESNYIRKQLNKITSLKRVNPRYYFDKWDTHKKLSKYEEIKAFLPETHLYETQENLEDMLKKHKEIFVKDSFGSNGKGIVKISERDGGYQFKCFTDKVVCHQVRDMDKLTRLIKVFIPSKKIILQQAINLLTLDGSAIDLRGTVQRNGDNSVEVVSLPVRIGFKDSPVTSTQTGSSVMMFRDFFKNQMDYTEEQIIGLEEQAKTFLRVVYGLMEKEYGRFGEIGIDFAIDVEGKIWFIECNAKPGYDSMYKAYGEEVITKTFQNPLEYGKYLWRI